MLFGVRNVASFWSQLFIRTPRPTILARVPDGNGQRTVCLPLAEHKLQSGLNLRCNLVRAQTILSQHRLRFSGLSKAVPNPYLGQPVCPLTFKSIAYGIAQAANNAMLLDAEQLCAGCRISAYKVRIHGFNGM